MERSDMFLVYDTPEALDRIDALLLGDREAEPGEEIEQTCASLLHDVRVLKGELQHCRTGSTARNETLGEEIKELETELLTACRRIDAETSISQQAVRDLDQLRAAYQESKATADALIHTLTMQLARLPFRKPVDWECPLLTTTGVLHFRHKGCHGIIFQEDLTARCLQCGGHWAIVTTAKRRRAASVPDERQQELPLND